MLVKRCGERARMCRAVDVSGDGGDAGTAVPWMLCVLNAVRIS